MTDRERHELARRPSERQADEPRRGAQVRDDEHAPPVEPVPEPARERLHETLHAHREQQGHREPDRRLVGQAVDHVPEHRERGPAPGEGDTSRNRHPPYR